MTYENKHVLFGVTGGIAIYKTLDLIRSLKRRGITVEVVMTRAAQEFITPLTFKEVTGLPVHLEIFSPSGQWRVEHISLARKTDLVAIIPATANIIGKLAAGIADDLLTTTVLATKSPVIVAPAMNSAMYEHPILQKNLDLLSKFSYKIIPADSGSLLCGEEGRGRLAPLEVLEETILCQLTSKELNGKRVLVTAGPTREYLDPVRFISNASTGRMGYALAREAKRRGAEVTLISGPSELTPPPGIRLLLAISCREMYQLVMDELPKTDIFIMAAAPADYRPIATHQHKLKKTTTPLTELKVESNPDIALAVGKEKGDRLLAIFAAETRDLITNAHKKLVEKKADLVIANNVLEKGAGFGGSTNKVTILTSENTFELPLLSKEEAASEIITVLTNLLLSRKSLGEER